MSEFVPFLVRALAGLIAIAGVFQIHTLPAGAPRAGALVVIAVLVATAMGLAK